MSPSTSASPSDPQEIAAIELALQFKGNLAALGSLERIQLRQGPSVGAVWTVVEVARRLGVAQALGSGFAAQLALWQVVARVLDQGSRLSAGCRRRAKTSAISPTMLSALPTVGTQTICWRGCGMNSTSVSKSVHQNPARY
jgi:hypothetical protein